MSIQEVNAGSWVSGAALGWPLDRLGSDAEFFIVPLPSHAYQALLRKITREIRAPADSPRYYREMQHHLPRLYAETVMTQMHGVPLVRSKPDLGALEDTTENRRLVLDSCPLLLERVYRFATQGPAGIESWQRLAGHYRAVAVEVKDLIRTAGTASGVAQQEILDRAYMLLAGVEDARP